MFILHLMIACVVAMLTTLVITFPVKRLAYAWGVLDVPNHRKIHDKVTPQMGGLAIFIGAFIGGLYLQPHHEHLPEILAGAVIILMTGLLDDRFQLRPVVKLTGQFIATSLLISSGLIIERLTLPVIGTVELGIASVLVTVIWVIGITNAINLIDGLDGLATGVSTIALTSLFFMALIDGQQIAAYLSIVLIGANIGFLFHNFYPASIYMGDTGSNFLGFMIAVVSMVGLFKNVTLFSFIIPVIVLAVPIFDTLFAMIRRTFNQESILKADNKHIHYQLLANGYTHKQTVLIIYGFSGLFGALGILFSKGSMTMSLFIACFILLLLYLLAEMAGLFKNGKRPILDFLVNLFKRQKRDLT